MASARLYQTYVETLSSAPSNAKLDQVYIEVLTAAPVPFAGFLLGTDQVPALKVGSAGVTRAYVGATQVFGA